VGELGLDTSGTPVAASPRTATVTRRDRWARASASAGFAVQGLSFAAVFSDGVQSFQKQSEGGSCAPIPCRDVVRELTAFKSFTGVFARRRLRRFEEDAADRGWSHHDDLSMAALCFGPREEGG